ncbi:3-hydroxyacyl-CoA dehydrogenase [Rossellomorea sp. SC111]|uniref:3-hydroxyacyl-CoA dehydrogenase n=1 Tax=Rossellomorea sp. SC111 TaxID=2968985 RepID=UPI00215B39B4|nr:3-hydroxyacyl-CoA dehydrogenase [Rossellomorea sp. SC111]MCR8849098.1 3-hydroxyacyl-CoA dehydrogenase [Rossellomorea sp. SC111]
MLMKDSLAVITGGASGLGEATARKIMEEGGKVYLLDLNGGRSSAIKKEYGDSMGYVETDVTREDSVKEALERALEAFGGINTVVNCAGIAPPGKVVGRKGIHSLDQFSKVIEVNLIGTFNVIRMAAEKMMLNITNEHGEKGVIVNTASVAAFEGQIGQAAYSASKGGVVGMTLPIARELASEGIRVMTIAPGLFHTPMFDTLPEEARQSLGNMVPFPKRLGYPSEYAQLVKSILENPMLNGETIRLDGAIRMQPK